MSRRAGIPKTVRGQAGTGLAALCLLLTSLSARDARAQAARAETAEVLTEARVIEQVTEAIDKGLEYMAGKQRPDGSWFDNNAVNALAILAFLGRGHVPERGPYRDVLERGKRYVIASQNADGVIISKGSMYEHALATLALAEMYGMDPDPEVEQSLRKATDVILRAQSPNGGWRYKPQPGDHDLSVTVMQIVALRAANNAEIPVPEATIKKAVGYVRSCAVGAGGFSYQPGQGRSPQVTAAGILSLQLLGRYADPRIPPALTALATYPVQWGGGGVSIFYYFHYYAIQAEYQAGGEHWRSWHPKVRQLLLTHQNKDGSWDVPPGGQHETNENVVGPDRIYPTAMACLVLEIYNHFLPAYQR